MSIGPEVERRNVQRQLRDHLARIEALERTPMRSLQNRPWFRQSLTFGGGPLTVPFLDTETLTFDAEDFGDGGDAYFGSTTGPDRFTLLQTNMRVGITFEVWWEDFDFPVQFQIHDGGSVSAGISFDPFGTQDGSTHAGYFVWRSSPASTIEIKLANNDPVNNRDVFAAYVELSFLGFWTGTDPHDDNPDF